MVLSIGVESLSVRARMRVEATPLIERFFYQVYVHEEEPQQNLANRDDDEHVTLDNVPLPGDH